MSYGGATKTVFRCLGSWTIKLTLYFKKFQKRFGIKEFVQTKEKNVTQEKCILTAVTEL